MYFKGREKKYRPIKIKPFVYTGDDNELLKKIKCDNMPYFGENSGRRSFLLRKIGYMKRLGISRVDRERMVRIINNKFVVPLDEDEVNTVIKTTVQDKKGK